MFAPLRNVSMFNSLFVGGALRDDTNYSRFSHDVTKIQTKKLSLLLSFYFHVVLQHLKTFTPQIFGSKGLLVLRHWARLHNTFLR